MPKDHYVAQTYLDHFCDADSKLWVYSKEWESVKNNTTGRICYEHDGSDNPYLKCPRAIEEYLKPFENGWGAAVKLLDSDGDIDLRAYLEAKSIHILSYNNPPPPLDLKSPASDFHRHLNE